MIINDSILQNSEKISLVLRELYIESGYKPYRMSKFEEYDLYAQNKDFLVSDNVITFTDTTGRLMALKPDVTLSIIKNNADAPGETTKVFYNENVYRISKNTGSYKEIMQTGVECFGKVTSADICEVIRLAAKSLAAIMDDFVLAVSDLGVMSLLVSSLALTPDGEQALYKAIGERNIEAAKKICEKSKFNDYLSALLNLIALHGPVAKTLPEAAKILGKTGVDATKFIDIATALSKSEYADKIYVDFSVIGDVNYYNGIVFKGFLRDVPTDVLSGGEYDKLMKKLGRESSAIGFAVYEDALDRVEPGAVIPDDGFINIALPKGRLGEKVYSMFAAAGFECPSLLEPGRKLIFENEKKGVRYFWVKPSDVPIYVERGAADIGVAGKDIIEEYSPDVYELVDLKKGTCRMTVSAPRGYVDDESKTLRVATKFAETAKDHYRSKGRDIDIIHLNGSIEIAPILGLSDVIVDIVETGTTLKENDLEIIETIEQISARLISNKSSYKFKFDKIKAVADGISTATEEEK